MECPSPLLPLSNGGLCIHDPPLGLFRLRFRHRWQRTIERPRKCSTSVRKRAPRSSRRCVQNTIRSVTGIKRGSLQDEIADLIAAGLVTSGLAAELDAVRNIGNFAAHPIKDTRTGEIIDVEPGEAEWNLDLLDRLFDELIVGPAKSAARKTALNARLKAAGKPEIP